MKRWSSNLLCGLSLLIFLLAMGIWVRSYFVGESVFKRSVWTDATTHPATPRSLSFSFGWARGTVAVCRWEEAGASALRPAMSGWFVEHYVPTRNLIEEISWDDRVNLQLGPFQVLSQFNKDWSRSHRRVVLPLWVFALFAIPPGLWVRRWRRGRGGRGFAVQLVETAA